MSQFTMSSDLRRSEHRRMETAFQAASKARNEGAYEIRIEHNIRVGNMYQPFRYELDKTSDGTYVSIRGTITEGSWKQVEIYCLRYSLPFVRSDRRTFVYPDGTTERAGFNPTPGLEA